MTRRSSKPLSEAHRAAISAGVKGKPKSAEHRAKIAASMTGQKRTPEQCANISAGKRGDNPTYRAVHARLGSVSGHSCPCGAPAKDWAFQHDSASPLYTPDGRAYSADPTDYKPMCRKCHNEYDGGEARRAADGTYR